MQKLRFLWIFQMEIREDEIEVETKFGEKIT